MTLPELNACLDNLGVKVWVVGDRLVVDAPLGALTTEVKTALVNHKPALLTTLVGIVKNDRPAELSTESRTTDRYAIEERAAIYEFDAGMTRNAAGRAAGLIL